MTRLAEGEEDAAAGWVTAARRGRRVELVAVAPRCMFGMCWLPAARAYACAAYADRGGGPVREVLVRFVQRQDGAHVARGFRGGWCRALGAAGLGVKELAAATQMAADLSAAFDGGVWAAGAEVLFARREDGGVRIRAGGVPLADVPPGPVADATLGLFVGPAAAATRMRAALAEVGRL